MRYTFIVAAAGSGKRMGLKYPKQFLEYQGKPIFIKTLESIDNSPVVTEIVVVTNEEYVEKVKKYCERFGIKKPVSVVPGGDERQDSIYNALSGIKGEGLIAIQDGVRPFLENRFIEEAYELLRNSDDIDGVVVGVPVKDTIKVIDENGMITSTPERKLLVAAQTPQVFKGDVLKRAYARAKENNFLGTDDSSLVEKIGGRVMVLGGSYGNIKITTQEDLKYLEE